MNADEMNPVLILSLLGGLSLISFGIVILMGVSTRKDREKNLFKMLAAFAILSLFSLAGYIFRNLIFPPPN